MVRDKRLKENMGCEDGLQLVDNRLRQRSHRARFSHSAEKALVYVTITMEMAEKCPASDFQP